MWWKACFGMIFLILSRSFWFGISVSIHEKMVKFREMKILGIESSCDETAAAVVEDGFRLLSNVVRSQIDIHKVYGGVVPEVAARSHIEVIVPVIEEALEQAACTWDDIDGIAVTYAPGLIGSLLVGTLAARTLALTKNIPLYPVHHVEGHVYANFLIEQQFQDDSTAQARSTPSTNLYRLAGQEMASPRSETVLKLPSEQPAFPMLALIVSGGHSQLVLFRDHGDYELLGQTQDDAVGEAFDKVAKILGLPYPGGPSVAAAAELGDPLAFTLPVAKLAGKYDFSFSGLKTAVLRAVQHEVGVAYDFPSHNLPERVSDALRANMSASFQYVAIKTLVGTTLKAFHDFSPASVVIAGGVAANQELRKQLQEALPIPIEYAPMSLCTDNAAMIATLGYYHAQKLAPTDPYDLEVLPSISMAKTAWGV
jgi:N6-L-threonylcarbamoyladenine synthase